MRKGQVGDWKNFFTDEDKATWDEWMKVKKRQFNIEHEMTLTI